MAPPAPVTRTRRPVEHGLRSAEQALDSGRFDAIGVAPRCFLEFSEAR
jgi:hypothetical protein